MTDKFDKLVHQSIVVGSNFPVMPIDEIRLASAFAALPNQKTVVTRLMTELFEHPNMHVRRIAVNACRRSAAFDVPGLQEALVRKLRDPEPWVQYDAAWALQAAGFDTPEIRQLLTELSAGVMLPDDEARVRSKPSDAALQLKVQARKTLLALLAAKP